MERTQDPRTTQVPDLNGPQDPRTSGPEDPRTSPTPGSDTRVIRDQVRSDLRVREADAAADRDLRTRSAKLRLKWEDRNQRRTQRQEDLQARRDQDRSERDHRTQVRNQRLADRKAAWTRRTNQVRDNTDAVLGTLVYTAAIASAVFGQVSVATSRYEWSTWRALLLAGFIEIIGLAMATTANRLRLRGERATTPRVLTWVFAGFAATVNIWGHSQDMLMAIGLGAASIGGITMWEIRSSARHRDALRRMGMLGQPMTRFGWRAWILYFSQVRRAWKLDVLSRLSGDAANLIRVEAQQQHTRRVQAAILQAAEEASRTARIAAKSGQSGPALDALKTYAQVLRTYAESPVRVPTTQVLSLPAQPEVRSDLVDQDQVPAVSKDPDPTKVPAQDPTDPAPIRTQDPGPQVLTPGPEDCQPSLAKVRQLRTRDGEDPYLEAVRSAYSDPSKVPTFSEVRAALVPVLAARGLKDSKSRTVRVLNAIRAERLASPATEQPEPRAVNE